MADSAPGTNYTVSTVSISPLILTKPGSCRGGPMAPGARSMTGVVEGGAGQTAECGWSSYTSGRRLPRDPSDRQIIASHKGDGVWIIDDAKTDSTTEIHTFTRTELELALGFAIGMRWLDAGPSQPAKFMDEGCQ